LLPIKENSSGQGLFHSVFKVSKQQNKKKKKKEERDLSFGQNCKLKVWGRQETQKLSKKDKKK